MRLDSRLRTVADFVPLGSRVADIGTDHAYLPVYLVESDRAVFAVAGDKNAGPCDAAIRTVQEHGLGEQISVRQGDGLEVLEPGEVDTICIAGMGGTLMAEILGACPDVLKAADSLVLQPMNDASGLRKWLYQHYWHIEDEELALADGRIYEIILAKRGRRKRPSPLMLDIGPVLWEKKGGLLQHHIEAMLFQNRRIAAGMEKSERAKKSRKYKEALENIRALEERLKW